MRVFTLLEDETNARLIRSTITSIFRSASAKYVSKALSGASWRKAAASSSPAPNISRSMAVRKSPKISHGTIA